MAGRYSVAARARAGISGRGHAAVYYADGWTELFDETAWDAEKTTSTELNGIQDDWAAANSGDPAQPGYLFGSGPDQILSAYGTGCWDGGLFYAFGGGNLNYGGNEVYRFNFLTGVVDRLIAPEAIDTGNVLDAAPYYAMETGPNAHHGYSAMAVHPTLDRLYIGSNRTVWQQAGQKFEANTAWHYLDLATNLWGAATQTRPTGAQLVPQALGVAENGGEVVFLGYDVDVFGARAYVVQSDGTVATGSLTTPNASTWQYGRMVQDTRAGKGEYYSLPGPPFTQFKSVTRSVNAFTAVTASTTGPTAVPVAADYDGTAMRDGVMWMLENGNTTTWRLYDIDSDTWSTHTMVGTPPTNGGTGANGRLGYYEPHDVLFYVSVEGKMWSYKPPAGV